MGRAGRGAPPKDHATGGGDAGEARPPARTQNTLQTLDRGLQALAMVADLAEGISVASLASGLGVHRAIAYRLVATLEGHGLVTRDGDGQIHLGAGLLTLANRFEPQLRARARSLLHALAQESGAAAFLSVPQGEECVAIMVAEPAGQVLRITYNVGSRHPLTLGAAGIAILAGRPEQPDDSDAVRQARRDGVSVTRSQLQRGAVGVASPVRNRGGAIGLEACVGIVGLDDLDVLRATPLVLDCACRLESSIG